MAVYEYSCPSCGLQFEKMKAMSKAEEPESCPECNATDTKKLISAANFAFTFPASQTKGMAPPNTGTSHDWNYDKVIGRDAEQKHKLIQERQAHKRGVIRDNPGATGQDLSRTPDNTYRVMKPEERKASEAGRAVHKKALAAIDATIKKTPPRGDA